MDELTPEQWLVSTDSDEQLSQKLLRRLAEHGLGITHMEPSEITAAREFLARTVPPKRSPDDDSEKRLIVPVVNVWIGGRKAT